MKVYELLLEDELKDGINAISVVGSPAMESQFITLSEQNRNISFAKINNEKQILLGVAMIPNKKIYRKDETTNEEFHVFFSSETVKKASELYLKKGNQSNANLEHDSEQIINGTVVESWIVEDIEKDKTALYGIDAPVGSWVVAMKVDDVNEWNKCKESGTGFSIEGIFSEKVILKKENMDFTQMKNELLDDLKSMFSKQVKLGMVKSKDGTASMEYDGETPMVGSAIFLVTPDGNVPTPVGEYELENDMILVVTEIGIIGEIKEANAEVEVEVPTPAEAVKPEAMNEAGLKDMISSILVKFTEELDAKIEAKFAQATQKVDELKVELSAEPAVKKTNIAPNETQTKKPETLRGRLSLSLTELKNKN